MGVNREDSVFPSIYPCYNFMTAAGILQDFNTLISNAGLEHFVADEPDQYAKLTMSVVQNFRFSWTLPIPMVHYNIYNKAVDFPLHDFCAAIKVPYWGSDERIRGQPKHLQDLYSEICQGRGLTAESGKDGHSQRMTLTHTWRSTALVQTMREGNLRKISPSLSTQRALHISILTMELQLLLHRIRITIMLDMIRQDRVPSHVDD